MIKNQKIIIQQQQKLIDASVLQQSVVYINGTSEEEECEEVLGGTVAVTKYEGNGFEINLPNIFRRVKRLIGKEDMG